MSATPRPPPPTPSTSADLTAGLIDALGLISPVVLSWGLGGQVGLALAERHHQVASRLILVDSGAGGRGATAPAPSVLALFGSSLETTTALAGVMFPVDSIEKSGWLTRIAAIAPDDIVDTGVATEAAVEAAAKVISPSVEALALLKIPTLVVYGAQDEVFPAADSMELRRSIPHARSLVYADGGYAAMFQRGVVRVGRREVRVTGQDCGTAMAVLATMRPWPLLRSNRQSSAQSKITDCSITPSTFAGRTGSSLLTSSPPMPSSTERSKPCFRRRSRPSPRSSPTAPLATS